MKHRNIPIFISHIGCPLRCIFCNQNMQTGTNFNINSINIEKIVNEHLSTYSESVSSIEIAFFGGTFTGLDIQIQKKMLDQATICLKKDKRIKGIRLSTHPLMVDVNIINFLKNYKITTVELGIQSFNDKVLDSSNRGYDARKAKESFELLKKNIPSAGIQLMTGLPFDNIQTSYQTAIETVRLAPAFVRIYPTIVFPNTKLAGLYESGSFQPQSLRDAVDSVKKLIVLFESEKIPVIRAGIHPVKESEQIIAGPYHPSFRRLCEEKIRFDLLKLILDKDVRLLEIHCPSKEENYYRGNKKGRSGSG